MAADQPEASEQVPSQGEVSISPDGQDVLPGDGAIEESSTVGDSTSRKIDWESRAREFQGAKDRLESKVKSVLPLVEQYGGEGIQNLLSTFEKILQHPDLGTDVKSFISDPDSYKFKRARSDDLDDEFEDIDRPWASDVEEIRSMLGQVTELAHGLQRNQGMSSIEGYTKKFLDAYPMSDEERAKFVESMDGKFGAMNGPSTAGLIQNMTYEQYKHMALPSIEEFRSDIEARRLMEKRRDIQRKATDAPGVATHGAEAPASRPLPRNLREVQATARAAMRRGADLE
jgi:hypothetical protein